MRVPADAPILTADAMRAAEDVLFRTEPQEAVMERAGAAVAREAARFARGQPILVLAGPGNNGGDAYVAARLLAGAGIEVSVAAAAEPATAAAQMMRARWDGPVASLYEAQSRPVLVDGLFGTGLSRPLERGVAPILAELVRAARFSLAIDLPSGLDADTGETLGAPAMTATLALGALKPAHLLGDGPDRCGHVLLAEIGIADEAGWRTLARPQLAAPARDAHKYSRGLVAVVGGAMPGAARLAARAALAGGAGYVLLGAVEAPVGAADAIVHRRIDDAADLVEMFDDERIGAVVVGPGLGRDRRSEGLLKVALASDHPLVIDGDGLTMLGRSGAAWLAQRQAPTWLTPHSGEFDRMFGEGPGSKIDRTLAAAAESGATVIHKGADTVIATPRGEVRVGAGAPTWLASAGTGDVLAGLVAAQVAQGAEDAAAAALWIHARAAQLAGPALIADQLIGAVPRALAECL